MTTRSRHLLALLAGCWAFLFMSANLASAQAEPLVTPNVRCAGYQGIWFSLGQVGDYGDKYSGGLGTYTAKHRPVAIHAPQVNKTFFVYGGAKEGEQYLLNMIGYYDHATGLVPQPVVVHDKQGVYDPHDNSTLAIDGDGHIWVFVSGRGRGRPGFKYRSRKPYDIDAFEQISEEEFTYPQPVWIEGCGFLHCFTKYTNGRELYWNTRRTGAPGHKTGSSREWSVIIKTWKVAAGEPLSRLTTILESVRSTNGPIFISSTPMIAAKRGAPLTAILLRHL